MRLPRSYQQLLLYVLTPACTLGPWFDANHSAHACPSVTRLVGIHGNLDAAAPLTVVPYRASSFQALASSASASTTFDVVDTVGGVHNLTLYVFHTGGSLWEAQLFADGANIVGGAEGVPHFVGRRKLMFTNRGLQATGGPWELKVEPWWSTGARSQSIVVSLSPLSEYYEPTRLEIDLTSSEIPPSTILKLSAHNCSTEIPNESGAFCRLKTVATYRKRRLARSFVRLERRSPGGTAWAVIQRLQTNERGVASSSFFAHSSYEYRAVGVLDSCRYAAAESNHVSIDVGNSESLPGQ